MMRKTFMQIHLHLHHLLLFLLLLHHHLPHVHLLHLLVANVSGGIQRIKRLLFVFLVCISTAKLSENCLNSDKQ